MGVPKEPHALQDYQLGDLLGKGASGQVFRALNFTNGETVAVKQIQLSNIPKAELGEIMSEIDLLKNLNHPNIVKYKGFVKTKEFLYIILEYCENGSLHAICKRFGKFPENLVAVYISQVLEGLVYLHDQGVIHRDIKGANILTNKDGRVKLADFGVATDGVSDSSVVGSPYWMAPEVIEQAGASTASDIWSVGCVVIELLEGKPPYHSLEPMQALFRIVQDDSPPIPAGCSEIVKDFLLACFQKDPNLRVSAKKLMRHGWMAAARRQIDKSQSRVVAEAEIDRRARAGRGGGEGVADAGGVGTGAEGGAQKPLLTNHDERIMRVQEWNEKLEKTSYAAVTGTSRPAQSTTRRPSSGYGLQFPPLNPAAAALSSASAANTAAHTVSNLNSNVTPTNSLGNLALSSNSNASSNASSPTTGQHGREAGGMMGMGMGVHPMPSPTGEKKDPVALMRQMEEREEFSDNWDDDFADESIDPSRLAGSAKPVEKLKAAPARSPANDEGDEDEPIDEPEHWNQKTIMPSRSPSLSNGSNLPDSPSISTTAATKKLVESADDDYSDLGGEDDLAEKVKKLKLVNNRGLLHPKDLKAFSFTPSVVSAGLPPSSSSSASTSSPTLYLPPPKSTDPLINENRPSPLSTTPSRPNTLIRHVTSPPTSSISLFSNPSSPLPSTSASFSSSTIAPRNYSSLRLAPRSLSDSPTSTSFAALGGGGIEGVRSPPSSLRQVGSRSSSTGEMMFGGGGASGSAESGSFGRSSSGGGGGGVGGGVGGGEEGKNSELSKYSEGVEEDYDDVFGKVLLGKNASNSSSLRLNTKLSSRSWSFEDQEEVDPFAEFDEAYEDFPDLETNLVRDKLARLTSSIVSIIEELQPHSPDFTLKDACDQLINIFTEVPEMQRQFVSSHGMLAILEVLEAKPSREVILRMLRIVNMITIVDIDMLESFCLVGGIPVVISFTSKKYSSECRLESAVFISVLCNSSVLTLQMFISCRGLKVLVELLDEDYSQHRDLVISALGGIGSVFQLQSPTPRNDFARMFIREGLEDPLSTALFNITSDKDEGAADAKAQILAVFLLFCQVSQADSRVREALGKRRIIRRVLNTCNFLEPVLLVEILKSIKHLSTNTSTLEVLQNANAIEILTDVLGRHMAGPQSKEICNHILQTLFNLCRLNRSRQEEAAQAGVVPLLKRIVKGTSQLKQFALPILLDFASAGKSTRMLLWQNQGLQMYLELTSDPYWQGSAMEAILDWLQEETARVEDILLEEASLDQLVDCFVNAKGVSFDTILDPFLKIVRLSSNIALGISKPSFFRRLVERLSKTSKAVVRLNLLRLTRAVAEVHPDRAGLVERFGLWEIVERLSRQDEAILVRELAKEILPTLGGGGKTGTAAAAAAGPVQSVHSRRALRRTSSESTVSNSPLRPLPSYKPPPMGRLPPSSASTSSLAPSPSTSPSISSVPLPSCRSHSPTTPQPFPFPSSASSLTSSLAEQQEQRQPSPIPCPHQHPRVRKPSGAVVTPRKHIHKEGNKPEAAAGGGARRRPSRALANIAWEEDKNGQLRSSRPVTPRVSSNGSSGSDRSAASAAGLGGEEGIRHVGGRRG